VVNKRDRRKVGLRKGWQLNEDFRQLWDRIKYKTRYRVEFETAELVALAAKLLKDEPDVSAPQIAVSRSQVTFTAQGVEEAPKAARNVSLSDYRPPVPDIIGYLQRETELTRSTLAEILFRSGRITQALINPQEFMELAASAIEHAKQQLMVDGIKYERIDGHSYEMQLFESEEIESYLNRLFTVEKSIHEAIEYDSEVERKFAEAMENNENIRLFVKLPRWFKVETPLGSYNPDWAIVRESDGRVYLVAETKGSTDAKKLPDSERLRLKCGRQHFEGCLKVPYKLAKSLADLN
jgi:type III restriction enzyme